MKKVLNLAIVGLFALLLAACSGSGSGNPKAVAEKFFDAMQTMNMDEAKKYATSDSKAMLDLVKMGMTMAPNSDSIKAAVAKQKIVYSDAEINGDEAKVSVTVDDKETTNFTLRKEEGEWKVAFDKNTLMQIGMDKAKEKGASADELKEAQEALNLLNSDSLDKVMEKASQAMKEGGEAMKEASKMLDSLKINIPEQK